MASIEFAISEKWLLPLAWGDFSELSTPDAELAQYFIDGLPRGGSWTWGLVPAMGNDAVSGEGGKVIKATYFYA